MRGVLTPVADGVGRAFAYVTPSAVAKAASSGYHNMTVGGATQREMYANRVVILGLGRIVALYHRSFTLHRNR